MPGSYVSVLGPVQLTVDDQVVPLASPTQRRLLLRLALDAPQAASVDAIADAIWETDLPRDPANAVRYHVWKLREAIGDAATGVIATTPGGYRLTTQRESIDSDAFESLVSNAADCVEADPHQSAAISEHALSLWRGAPYVDADDAEFAQPEITRITEARRVAEETRAKALVNADRTAEAVPLLEGLLERFPFSEGLWSALMVALYREGRHGEALRAYRRAQDQLGEELGIEPSPELQALEEQMLLHDPSLSGDLLHRSNLPTMLADLIGRGHDLDHLHQLLTASRLVSIVGVGGAGKTHLALELGHIDLPMYRDGVWLVDLTRFRTGDDLFGAIARILQLSVGDEALDTSEKVVLAHLAPRTTLLVMDSCEHLVDEVATVVSTILTRCSQVRILTTSRSSLAVPGEAVYAIPTLDVPSAIVSTWDEISAVAACRMFIDRAISGGAQVDSTDESATIVANICRTLEGLPLAIELAARRVRTMGLLQMESRLGDLFDTLSSQRGPDERHRTISAMVQWSYDLLTSKQQLLFDRLSVFVGGFGLAAADEVCSDGLLASAEIAESLDSLVEQSMVERIPATPGRYRMLAPLRTFAAERLQERDESARIVTRHIAFFRELASQAEKKSRSNSERDARLRLSDDSANLRAAMTALTDRQDWDQLGALAGLLAWSWMRESRLDEIERWTDTLRPHLEAIDANDAARLHILRAFLAVNGIHPKEGVREIEKAMQRAKEAGNHTLEADVIVLRATSGDILVSGWPKDADTAQVCHAIEIYERAQDTRGTVEGLLALAQALLWTGKLVQAVDPIDRAVAIATESGNDSGLAWALFSKAHLRIQQSRRATIDAAEVPALLNQAISISRRIGEHGMSAAALMLLGSWLQLHRDPNEAARVLTEAVAEAEIRGNLFFSTTSSAMLAETERSLQNFPSAIDAAIRALDRGMTRSVEPQIAWVVEVTAGLLTDLGSPDLGAKLIGAAEALRVGLGDPMPAWDIDAYLRTVTSIKRAEGDDYAVHYAEGADWSITHAAQMARSALEASVEHLATRDNA